MNVIDGSIKFFFYFQMEIAKRLNAIIAQLLPFLSQEVRLHCSLKEKEYRISIYISVTVFWKQIIMQFKKQSKYHHSKINLHLPKSPHCNF